MRNTRLLRLYARMPLLGLVSRLSRGPVTNGPWTPSEARLCDSFYVSYSQVDMRREQCLEDYHQAEQYLQKTQELGRKPKPAWMRPFLALLVVLQALGGAVLLSGWAPVPAMGVLSFPMLVAFALVISAGLVVMGVWAGEELWLNAQHRKIRRWASEEAKEAVRFQPDHRVGLNNNARDDGMPTWQMMLNRIPANAGVGQSWYRTLGLASLMLLLGWGVIQVRTQVLEKSMLQHRIVLSGTGGVTAQPDESLEAAIKALGLDSTALVQPTDVATLSPAFIDQAESIQRQGAAASAWMFMTMLAAMNLAAVLLGYRHALVGRESVRAAALVRRFPSAEACWQSVRTQQRILAGIAQWHLSDLQRRMGLTVVPGRDFEGYLTRLHGEDAVAPQAAVQETLLVQRVQQRQASPEREVDDEVFLEPAPRQPVASLDVDAEEIRLPPMFTAFYPIRRSMAEVEKPEPLPEAEAFPFARYDLALVDEAPAGAASDWQPPSDETFHPQSSGGFEDANQATTQPAFVTDRRQWNLEDA